MGGLPRKTTRMIYVTCCKHCPFLHVSMSGRAFCHHPDNRSPPSLLPVTCALSKRTVTIIRRAPR